MNSDIVKESYEKDGYVIIDDFLFTDVVDELHDLAINYDQVDDLYRDCLLYTSPSPRDRTRSRMPSSA